jgi:hypothetical protein
MHDKSNRAHGSLEHAHARPRGNDVTDDKPPINLAYERKARSRDFALEYKQLMTNGRNIGLDDASCKAFAIPVVMFGVVEGFSFEHNAERPSGA